MGNSADRDFQHVKNRDIEARSSRNFLLRDALTARGLLRRRNWRLGAALRPTEPYDRLDSPPASSAGRASWAM